MLGMVSNITCWFVLNIDRGSGVGYSTAIASFGDRACLDAVIRFHVHLESVYPDCMNRKRLSSQSASVHGPATVERHWVIN